MARPKEFNTEEVLEKAIRLFRQQGYTAASIQDLTEATGLSRSSLYDTFGDKHALYLAALNQYIAQRRRMMQYVLNQPLSKKEGLRAYLTEFVKMLMEEEEPGCLAVEAATELAGRDKEVSQIIARNIEEIKKSFLTAVLGAQQQGEISQDKDPEALAAFLVNATFGLRVIVKANRDRRLVTDIVSVTLSILD